MKKLIIGMGIAAMVMGMASMASAAFDPSWVIKMSLASDSAGAKAATASVFNTLAGDYDGFGAGDSVYPSVTQVYAYTYTNIPGKVDNYYGETKSSFAGVTKTWDIYVAAGGGYTTGGDIWLFAWNPINTSIPSNPNNDFNPLGGETIKLWDVTATGRNLLWTVDSTKNGTGAAAQAAELTYRSKLANGLNSHLQLEVATAVPEPGSMVAMLSGLAGLVGFGVRRRK